MSTKLMRCLLSLTIVGVIGFAGVLPSQAGAPVLPREWRSARCSTWVSPAPMTDRVTMPPTYSYGPSCYVAVVDELPSAGGVVHQRHEANGVLVEKALGLLNYIVDALACDRYPAIDDGVWQ